ncbi:MULTISPECIES: FAD binding domain-containing protein [unclassified Xanthobacter]|uniref:FAD binding domain-containing protein n=1 Tax=unclassified Xanthobacter TaxID=2623496 RepID=UPI001EDE6C74|nr:MULTISPECIES: xanthine dehydrogenase family protein subunit M [unclassified Xanthobacter]
MKPARFDYVRAESIAHAVEVLANAGGDGKVLAGGQSLMPMMNFRLVKPSVLVDINHIPGLDRIELGPGAVRLGALVRHRMTAQDLQVARHIPVLHHAMKHVAHLTVRNRGTFCGSVCHADPAAEMPMMTLLLDGTIHVASPHGTRTMAARDFLTGALTTALAADEMVTAVDLVPPAAGTGWGFEEFSRRHGDYALAAIAVLMERADGRVRNPRIAMMGIADTALRLTAVEAALAGREGRAHVFDEAAELIVASITPNTDLNASADYRRHLAGALARRALSQAWDRAGALSGGDTP